MKRLDSKWEPNSRSPAWVKVKPEYVHKSEVDCVIVGADWGTGSWRSNKVSQFLLAIAVQPSNPAAQPNKFLTFCR